MAGGARRAPPLMLLPRGFLALAAAAVGAASPRGLTGDDDWAASANAWPQVLADYRKCVLFDFHSPRKLSATLEECQDFAVSHGHAFFQHNELGNCASFPWSECESANGNPTTLLWRVYGHPGGQLPPAGGCMYRLTPTELREEAANAVQLAEIEFSASGSPVTLESATNPEGNNVPDTQGPDAVIDGDTGSSQWSDLNKGALFVYAASCDADEFRFFTGDNSSLDPMQWLLELYVDGEWAMVHEQSVSDATPLERWTATEWFSLSSLPTPPPTPASLQAEELGQAEEQAVAVLAGTNGSSAVVTVAGPDDSSPVVFVVERISADGDANGSIELVEASAKIGVEVSVPASALDALNVSSALVVVSVLPAWAVPAGTRADGAISISMASPADGSFLQAEGLPDAIEFAITGAGGGLVCGYYDAEARQWTSEGMTTEREADGTLRCSTFHLTIFAAIAQGFTNALECSQASLLSEQAYRELWTGDWQGSLGSQLLCVLLSMFSAMMLTACVLDGRDARRGHWRTEDFLVPTGAGGGAAGALQGPGGGIVGDGARDVLDEVLNGFFEFFGNIREAGEALWADLRDAREGRTGLEDATMKVLGWSTARQAAASLFVHRDDAEFLTGPQAQRELQVPMPGETDDHGAPLRTLAGAATSGDSASARRHSLLAKLAGELRQREELYSHRHRSWCNLPRMALLSFLMNGPVGAVFARSLLMRRSMRALLLGCQVLGALLLATVFFSASGSAHSKDSPEECLEECEGDEHCEWQHLGQLIAVGLVSALVASVPLAIITSVRGRRFVHVPLEGGREWRRQLRKWRRQDAFVYVVGTLYSLFAINYVALFFANVSPEDQLDWFQSASVSLVENFILGPSVVAVAMPAAALLMIGALACWRGTRKGELLSKFRGGSVPAASGARGPVRFLDPCSSDLVAPPRPPQAPADPCWSDQLGYYFPEYPSMPIAAQIGRPCGKIVHL